MKVIIAGGGTGGHLFPGIAVAREIERRDPASSILFVGAEQGIEARIVPKEGFNLQTLPVGGIKGVGVVRQVRNLGRNVAAVFKAWQILREYKPDAVIGVGGYASFPMLSAAILELFGSMALLKKVVSDVGSMAIRDRSEEGRVANTRTKW